MSDYKDFFGDLPSSDDPLFEQRRYPQDIFGGDFYNEEEQVCRGFRMAPMPGTVQSAGEAIKGGLFGLPAQTHRLKMLPDTDGVDLEVCDVPQGGKTSYSAAAPTDLAAGVLEYFANTEALAMPREAKRAIKVHLVARYEFLKLKASFCIPKSAPELVALTFERKQGDGVEFMSTVRACEQYLRERGLLQGPAAASPPFSAALAPHLAMGPSLGGGDFGAPMQLPLMSYPGAPDYGDRTPNFQELPSLDVEACTPEDLQPLLNMATEPYGAARAEAAVEFCRMVDGETDADVVGQVLQANPQVLPELLAEPLCAFSAPALAAKLAPRGVQLDWPAVAQLLVLRVAQAPKKDALARRMYARALNTVLAYVDAPGLQPEIAALQEGIEDSATRQCLQEASFQCLRAA
jgi:phage tail protein X